MKKLFGLLLVSAALLPVVSHAATTRGELRRDVQDIREEQREYRDAQRYGDRRDIREERGEYRDAKREYREDLQDWRQDRRGYGQRRGYGRGNWNAPFGYTSYRPGYRARPRHYSSRYAIGQGYSRGLPQAYRGQRWVRHHDDALLIDIRSGYVRRVVRGFYW
jgi:Ni/Co efflux regulator RcnB